MITDCASVRGVPIIPAYRAYRVHQAKCTGRIECTDLTTCPSVPSLPGVHTPDCLPLLKLSQDEDETIRNTAPTQKRRPVILNTDLWQGESRCK